MNDNIEVGAEVTPDLDYKVKFESDNSDVEVINNTNTSGELSTSNPNLGDTKVGLTASVDEVSSDKLDLKLVDVSEFKYDLLTYYYDKDKIELSREVDGTSIILTIKAKENIDATTSEPYRLFDIIYPVTIGIEFFTDDTNYSINHIGNQCVYAVLRKSSMIVNKVYTLTLTTRPTVTYPDVEEWAIVGKDDKIPMNKVDTLVDESTGKINNSNIDYPGFFNRIELVLSGGKP